MPSRESCQENSDYRRNPDEGGFVGARICFGKICEKPRGEQERKEYRKRRQAGNVGHGKDAGEPKEQRFGERASEIERLSDQKDGRAVKEASEKRHGVAGLEVIADVEQHERRGMDRNGGRNENR